MRIAMPFSVALRRGERPCWSRRPLLLLVLLAALLLTGTRPLAAQSPAAWQASVVHTWHHVSDDRPAWQVYEAQVQRRHARGSVILKASHTRRFATGDEAFTAVVWNDLWASAYVHAYASYAPTPSILPGQTLYGELYQGLLGRWEVAGSYSQRRYPAQTLHLVGTGLGAYAGRWYLRAKTTLTRIYGRASIVQSLRARRYIHAPHEYVGVRMGGGRIAEVVAEGPVIETARTYFVTLQLRKDLMPSLGLTLTGTYSDDAFFVRRGLSVGLSTRW